MIAKIIVLHMKKDTNCNKAGKDKGRSERNGNLGIRIRFIPVFFWIWFIFIKFSCSGSLLKFLMEKKIDKKDPWLQESFFYKWKNTLSVILLKKKRANLTKIWSLGSGFLSDSPLSSLDSDSFSYIFLDMAPFPNS